MAFLSRHLRCGDCQIRHRAVCSRCDDDELARLDQIKFYRSYPAGQAILWAEDRMEFVGSIVSGVATLSQTLEDGRRQMVGLLLPSDFLGRPGRDKVSYDVQAATDVIMCCFHKRPFEAMMIATPHILERMLEMTLDELDAARTWMLLLGRKTARERIASLLASLARRKTTLEQRPMVGQIAIDLPLTREEMADYLGLTLETVSRQISALKRDGLIRLDGNRHVYILNLEHLVSEAGDDSQADLSAPPRVAWPRA